MWLLLEASIIIGCFALGCWKRKVAVLFLGTVGAFLAILASFVGNPMGLLASGGGWLMLDAVLFCAVMLANVLGR
jgi:hypothetical protein